MKKYEVIIDFESKTFIVEARNKEEAELKGVEEYEKYQKEEPALNFWVGDCSEVDKR